MKIKFENNTKSKIWMESFCFVPGTSIAEVSEEQKKAIDEILVNNKEIAEAVKEKYIVVSYEEDKKEEETKEKPKK